MKCSKYLTTGNFHLFSERDYMCVLTHKYIYNDIEQQIVVGKDITLLEGHEKETRIHLFIFYFHLTNQIHTKIYRTIMNTLHVLVG